MDEQLTPEQQKQLEEQQELFQKFQEIRQNVPEAAKDTGRYPAAQVQVVPAEIKQVPDLATGGMRNRHWVAVLSLLVSDHFERTGPNPVFPMSQAEVFDAETKEELRARLIHEIDAALEIAEQLPDEPPQQ